MSEPTVLHARYRVHDSERDRDSRKMGPRFEVCDITDDNRIPLLRFSNRQDALAVAAELSRQYRLWQRGAEVKRQIAEGLAKPEEFKLDPPERGFLEIEVTGYHAPYVEARRTFKYTNDLAPKSKWVLTLYYPGNTSDEHELVTQDSEVQEVVVAMSEAIRHLHEIHAATIVPEKGGA